MQQTSSSSSSSSHRSIEYVCRVLQLPHEATRALKKEKGLETLYQWQMECLLNTSVVEGSNLIYSAPTSGGKGLIADLMSLRQVMISQDDISSKVLIVLPFVSLVSEKERQMKTLVRLYNLSVEKETRIKVKAFYGNFAESLRNPKTLKGKMIMICTIEKSSSLFDALLLSDRINQLKLVVIDELHLLHDPSRGYMLEILVGKIKVVEAQAKSLREKRIKKVKMKFKQLSIQVIALSATIGNAKLLALWLNAQLYTTEFRPVPLQNFIKCGNEVLTITGATCEVLKDPSKDDPDHLIQITHQGLCRGQQTIVFCASRAKCEVVCKAFTKSLPIKCCSSGLWKARGEQSCKEIGEGIAHLQEDKHKLDCEYLFHERIAVVNKLRENDEHEDDRRHVLKEGIQIGVAYHHAGLSDKEREIVEILFKRGLISVLVATTTLAAGVNLPAGRVIIKGMSIGAEYLGCVQYKQMIGRAGRAGQTTYGDSFLLVTAGEKDRALNLSQQPIPDVVSQITPSVDGGCGLLKAILEQFNLGLSQSSLDVEMHIKQTLMYAECVTELQRNEVLVQASQCLEFLISSHAIECKVTSENKDPQQMMQPTSSSALFGDYKVPLTLSRFGKAICESNLKPDEAVVIYEELRRAQQMLNLETSLHLIYLIAPLQHCLIPNFELLRKVADSALKLKTSFRSLLEMLDITQRELDQWGSIRAPTRKEIMNCTHKLKLSKVSSLSSCDGSSEKSDNSCIDRKEIVLCRVKRLWAAMAIVEVFDGRKKMTDIADKYGVSTGDIESLIQSTRILSSQIQRFCSEIGWTSMEAMIKTCRDINFNPNMNADLENFLATSNKFMTRRVAQVLFESGVHDVKTLATSTPETIAQILLLKLSFECHPFEEESNDTKSWNNLLALSRNLIDAAKNHPLRPVAEQLQQSQDTIIHPDDRWECLGDSCSTGPESGVFEDCMESDDSSTDDSKDEVGKLTGESQDCDDIDRHCSHLRQSNPLTRMMDTSAMMTSSSADISYVDEDGCNNYLCYMNPSFPAEDIVTKGQQNSADLGLGEHIDRSNDQMSSIRDGELDLSPSSGSQQIAVAQQQRNTYNAVEDFENDEMMSEEILRYVEEMEQQAAIREATCKVPAVTPSSVHTLRIDHSTKDEAFKHALSPPPVNSDSPYVSALSPSNSKGTPGQYLYLPKHNMIQGISRDVYYEALESSLKITEAKGQEEFKYKSLYDPKASKSFFEKLSTAPCISFEVIYKELPLSIPPSSWTSLTSYRGHKSAQNICQSTDFTLLQAYSLSLETKKGENSAAKVLAGISFSFGDEVGFYLPLPTPLPLWLETGSDYTAVATIGPNETNSSNSREKQSIHINQLPSICKQLISRFVGYASILGTTFDNFRMSQVAKDNHAHIQDSVSSITNFGSGFHITKATVNLASKDREENDNACIYRNNLLSTSKDWMINARKGLLHEWRKGRCLEWRLVNDIMSNEKLTKIAVNIKSQIVCLRERDVIVKGPLMDPSIGAKLIENAVPHKSLPILPVLRIPNVNSKQRRIYDKNMNLYQFKEAVGSSFYVVSVFRTMAKLEKLMKGTSVGKVFHMVEMPLSIPVAEAEYSGVPMDKKFFLDLRQNLLDRCKMIEYYFSVIHPSGEKVNLCSPRDVNELFRTLKGHHHVINSDNSINDSDYKNFISKYLGRYVAEFRAHSLLQPLCTSILSDNITRRREEEYRRIRCTFNSIGTDTGRLIVSSPSLQIVPRECSYRPCIRPTLHEELMGVLNRNNDDKELKGFIQKLNSKLMNMGNIDIEWVRVSDKDGTVQGGKATAFKIGQLRLVTQQPITKPGVKTSSSSVSNASALMDSWIASGFTYPLGVAEKVFQVLITFDTGLSSKRYCYPADQVTRLHARINEDTDELNEILDKLKNPTYDDISQSLQRCSALSRVFLSPRDGIVSSDQYVLLSADYSQIELRLLAHFSADETLTSAFHDACGDDIFKVIASKWHNKPASFVSETERNNAKRICYAVIYGAGPKLVAVEQNCPLSEARKMMEGFLKTYPGITKFITDVKTSTKKLGYIETLLGRRRAIDGITSSDEKSRLKAERQAVNSVCQGSAADLVKLAMVNIFHQLDESPIEAFKQVRRIKSTPGGALYRQQDSGLRFLLQIHDELLFEVKKGHVDAISSVVQNCMENAVSLKVPLKVKIKTGKSWGELK